VHENGRRVDQDRTARKQLLESGDYWSNCGICSGVVGYAHTGSSQRFDFLLCGAFAAFDDSPGMTHARALRGASAGDESRHRFGHVGFDIFSSIDLGASTDLADEDDFLRSRIVLEHLQHVDEACADDGITTDPDTGCLSQAGFGQSMNDLIGEGAALRYHADVTGGGDIAGHDADFRLSWDEQTGAVGADQAAVAALNIFVDLHHLQYGDVLCRAYDQRNIGVHGFENGIRRRRSRDEDQAGVSPGSFYCCPDGVEDGFSFYPLAAFAGGNTADHVGAKVNHQLGMKTAFTPGDTLDDQAGVFVCENWHTYAPLAASTAF
jgi:hypothetical protein